MQTSPAYPETPLYSATATYADGRMIETTWAVDSLQAARVSMRWMHPQAVRIDAEFVMSLAEYLG